MGTLLSTYTSNRDNNFNLIRFIAASLVLFSHSFALSIGSGDAEPLKSTIGMTWGGIAVDIFFITSGFLITSSYFNRSNLLAFAWARILRIYPALIVAMVFCVFVVGLFFTNYSAQRYLLDTQTYQFFFKNITLIFGIEYNLPGVFLDVPYKSPVNGSLWTLPYEVKMYAMLALMIISLGYISKRFNFITVKRAMLGVAILATLINIFNHLHPTLPTLFIHLFSMFFIGASFFIWSDNIRLSTKWFLFALSLVLLSSINKDLFFIVYALLLPYLTFYLAYVPSGSIRQFNRFGDYSYGLYIYAFPVQQSTAALIPNVSVTQMIITSFLVTLFLAVMSWYLIEKPTLRMKGSYTMIEKLLPKNALTKWLTGAK